MFGFGSKKKLDKACYELGVVATDFMEAQVSSELEETMRAAFFVKTTVELVEQCHGIRLVHGTFFDAFLKAAAAQDFAEMDKRAKDLKRRLGRTSDPMYRGEMIYSMLTGKVVPP